MALLKRAHYLIAVLLLSACQPMDTRESPRGEQNLKNSALSPVSLLSTIQKQGLLALTADDESRAQRILEMNYTKQPSTWQAGGHKEISLTMVPERTYQEGKGIYCREYSVSIAQKNVLALRETACRYGENQWKLINKQKHVSVEIKSEVIATALNSEDEALFEVKVKQEIAADSDDGLESELVPDAEKRAAIAVASKPIEQDEVEQYFLALDKAENRNDADSVVSISQDVQKRSDNGPSHAWIIQLASFSKKTNAAQLVKRLENHGYEPSILDGVSNGTTLYRVNVELQGSYARVEKEADKLKSLFGLSPLFFRNR